MYNLYPRKCEADFKQLVKSNAQNVKSTLCLLWETLPSVRLRKLNMKSISKKKQDA
ncbi:unnamed protein product [Tenebrio molitor]|nr:unnamed protein product [Tenebrio molitor]